MPKQTFSCEFCLNKFFSTKWNQKRHFMQQHNFNRNKARNFSPEIKKNIPEEYGELMIKEEDLLNIFNTSETNRNISATVPEEYEELMKEDEDLLLHLEF